MAFTKEKTKELFNQFVNTYSDKRSKPYAYFRLLEEIELIFSDRVKEKYFVDQLMASVEEFKEKRGSVKFRFFKDKIVLRSMNDFAKMIDELDNQLEEKIAKVNDSEESDYVIKESPGLSRIGEE